MARIVKKQRKDIGISPDALLFRGEKRNDEVTLKMLQYGGGEVVEKSLQTVGELKKYAENKSMVWFSINGIHNPIIMEEISQLFNIDSLALSEIMNPHSRPKIQEFSNCIVLSARVIDINEKTNELLNENLSLVIMQNSLFSFHETNDAVFEPVKERIRQQRKRIVESGPDYLAFALLDVAIDHYIYVVGVLGNHIEALDNAVLRTQTPKIVEQIRFFKIELNYFRKSILPAKEMLMSLSKLDNDLVAETNDIHYKELIDNINQALESSDTYRQILSDQLNVYHSLISSKLNDIMKFLTIFSVIFIPLTFIVGIYGTNFDYVPELHFKYSYFIMWGIMIVLTAGMLYYFKKKRWL